MDSQCRPQFCKSSVFPETHNPFLRLWPKVQAGSLLLSGSRVTMIYCFDVGRQWFINKLKVYHFKPTTVYHNELSPLLNRLNQKVRPCRKYKLITVWDTLCSSLTLNMSSSSSLSTPGSRFRRSDPDRLKSVLNEALKGASKSDILSLLGKAEGWSSRFKLVLERVLLAFSPILSTLLPTVLANFFRFFFSWKRT